METKVSGSLNILNFANVGQNFKCVPSQRKILYKQCVVYEINIFHLQNIYVIIYKCPYFYLRVFTSKFCSLIIEKCRNKFSQSSTLLASINSYLYKLKYKLNYVDVSI